MATEPFRIEGLEGVLETLQELPPEVASKKGGPVRFALRKAAVVLQKEAQQNIAKIIADPNRPNPGRKSTGTLSKNVVVTRSKFKAGINGERFIVRVRRKLYPGQLGRGVTTKKVGALLEYGTERREPMPWMRPAFDTKKREAVATFARELPKKIEAVLKKLERENGVKR